MKITKARLKSLIKEALASLEEGEAEPEKRRRPTRAVKAKPRKPTRAVPAKQPELFDYSDYEDRSDYGGQDEFDEPESEPRRRPTRAVKAKPTRAVPAKQPELFDEEYELDEDLIDEMQSGTGRQGARGEASGYPDSTRDEHDAKKRRTRQAGKKAARQAVRDANASRPSSNEG